MSSTSVAQGPCAVLLEKALDETPTLLGSMLRLKCAVLAYGTAQRGALHPGGGSRAGAVSKYLWTTAQQSYVPLISRSS